MLFRSLCVLVVLVDAHLLGAVAAVDLAHDLLVGGLAAAEFEGEGVDLAYTTQSAKLGLVVVKDAPLLCSLSAPLVAWRDLKPFFSFFVVLRWWCDCAAMGAMLLPLPPDLNRKGMDATLTIRYQRQRYTVWWWRVGWR